MMNSLWIAKTGMTAQQTNLDVISHNLSNVSTTGFKRNFAVFQDLMYQNQRQVGAQTGDNTQLPTGLHVGLGVNVGSISRNFMQGALTNTGNALDIAINGQGFFQVQMPDGTTGYTRAGNFTRSSTGDVVTSEGYPLVPAINLQIGDTLDIGPNGQVSITRAGVTTAGPQIQLANFVNPAGLEPLGNNLYRETVASGAPEAGNPLTNSLGEIRHKFLENSNINVVEELVSMIQTQRAYEMNSKAIQTSDQMLAKLSQL
ncbi:flagellar basal-body rod protein FlgG [Acidovorax sp. IB03]|jgi:flagellar basal-body rod protein FlgG|uniref:flagellar basal-body rod protein FlgG n=1 Tax=Acidovorax sp. IB03 TaxID=2779366 RepID=UPI0018E71298|nr:flagellar basal-body rod protein FlgG [Acidovorax sp. IB03]MBJ2164020.1 flagellar basal-body rod protein FlgG [Acidovorax sp. IB03]